MNNAESREYELRRRIGRTDSRAAVYALLVLLCAALTLFFAFRDNRREVTAEGEHDYPVAYSAVSGSDACTSPSDIEERADSYLAQFREFDRTYCFEYWMQCQLILAGEPGYAPDQSLTEQAREDYDRYVLVTRTEREESRALRAKFITCAAVGLCGVIAAGLLGLNRARRLLLVRRLDAIVSGDSGDIAGDRS